MGDLRSVYRFLAPELVGAGYRVATMDLRGHGDSDATLRVPAARDSGESLLPVQPTRSVVEERPA